MCPVGESVGGCGAQAVSRKTPIYHYHHRPPPYHHHQVPASKYGGSLVVVLTGGNVTPGELAELGAGQSQAEKS